MTSRNYCFTSYIKPNPELETIKYMIYGEELCPTTQRTHWQGYVEFNSSIRIAAVKKLFKDDTLHLEKRKGTQEQAIEYCKKDGIITEYGIPSKQGKRTDLQRALEEKTIEDVIEHHPQVFVKYPTGIKEIFAHRLGTELPDIRDVDVFVYWGITGSGKTYKAITENEDYYKLTLPSKNVDRLWFHGYKGQKCLILDEFYGQVDYPYMLQILDKYKLCIEIKGGYTYAQWNKVIITSNQAPYSWYSNVADISALNRRLHTVIEFKDKYVEPMNIETE